MDTSPSPLPPPSMPRFSVDCPSRPILDQVAYKWSMMVLAVLFGAVAALVGFYLSYYLSVPSGGAIVLVATVLFLAVAAIVRGRGAWRRLMAARS